jgi:hypothetical protein
MGAGLARRGAIRVVKVQANSNGPCFIRTGNQIKRIRTVDVLASPRKKD